MFQEIPDLLTASEVAQLREFGRVLNLVDGRVTNPLSTVKNNLHADLADPNQKQSSDILGRALGRNAHFIAFAFPKMMAPPVLTKYQPGMTYGAHADAAFLPVGARPLRSDLSCTVFLNDPADYDGGELSVRLGGREVDFKLPPGAAVVYPSTTIHQGEAGDPRRAAVRHHLHREPDRRPHQPRAPVRPQRGAGGGGRAPELGGPDPAQPCGFFAAPAVGRRGIAAADCLDRRAGPISRTRFHAPARTFQGLPMADYAAARLNMVESQVRPADVTDVRLHDAMRELAREQFLPPAKTYLAYADIEVEYAPGRSLLKPRDVAKLLQAVRPMPGERALAIAAPYGAAVLERLGLTVTALDGDDLTQPPGGPFDLIVCEGAVGRAPEAWTAALAPRGRLAVIERDGPVGKACIYLRAEDGVGRREAFDATPPILAGFAAEHGFAFE